MYLFFFIGVLLGAAIMAASFRGDARMHRQTKKALAESQASAARCAAHLSASESLCRLQMAKRAMAERKVAALEDRRVAATKHALALQEGLRTQHEVIQELLDLLPDTEDKPHLRAHRIKPAPAVSP